MPTSDALPRRPRGRPAQHGHTYADTRDLLIRRGMELLTEQGIAATSIERVLQSTGIPKGSFYHYFATKHDFTLVVMDAYHHYFCRKLTRYLEDESLPPLARLVAFVDSACRGMTRYAFQRGCLVGNLGQEVVQLSPELRLRLEQILLDWEALLARCLRDAVTAGELPPGCDCPALAHQFWIGWEGAVLRARLVGDTEPMLSFFNFFMKLAK
ncbi:acrylate utilization transcriptional regulator AcuR [Aeromonas caviae]|uniref:acrylate utilization transcriptional regulator AcuR n=1 Tax=Aeromonas caviae TaxID=648 RepID=UPI0029D4B80D|nr:TetR/AcrR family transcriptional regulator [Aeromonas caviae]MDX7711717.1 TetR/AcrR family transcriptional regulator [Aeromonas caviae]